MASRALLLGAFCAGCLAATEADTGLYLASLNSCVQARQEAGLNDNTLIVLKNDITDDGYIFPLPVSVGAVRIEYMDDAELRDRLRHSAGSLPAIRIKPMRRYRSTLTVHCEEFAVSLKKKTLFLRLEKGTAVRWTFDTTAGDFIFTGAERSGPKM